MNATSTPHATGVNRGSQAEQGHCDGGEQPHRGQLDGRGTERDGQFAGDVACAGSVCHPGDEARDQHCDGRTADREHQMACQPTGSVTAPASTASACWVVSSWCSRRVREMRERRGHHPEHAERDRDESLLHGVGAAQARHDVTGDPAVADLVADAVDDAADDQTVQAQPNRPQHQRATVESPGQRRDAAQARPGAAERGPGARRAARRRRRGAPAVGRRAPSRRRGERRVEQQHPEPGPRQTGGPAATSPAATATTGAPTRGRTGVADGAQRERRRQHAERGAARDRALGDSCAVTAATAVNTRPGAGQRRPRTPPNRLRGCRGSADPRWRSARSAPTPRPREAAPPSGPRSGRRRSSRGVRRARSPRRRGCAG